MRDADGREQQPQVIVDFRNRSNRGARTARRGLLFDGDGRGKSLDGIDIRGFQPIEELTRVGGKGFHIAALAFGIDRVEGETRLSRIR